MMFPWLGFSEKLPLPKFVLLSDARLPSPEVRLVRGPATSGTPKSSAERIGGLDPLKSIPVRVADFLLEVYISRVMPSYPIFHEPWLVSCHAAVIHRVLSNDGGTNRPSSYEIFITSLVMAISLSTAARSKQARANDMAFKLFQHAITRLGEILTNDFAGLQALVLLHTYAVMNPAAANVYFLSGYMMQACIDQELHKEDTRPMETDLLAQDLKRRVFWSAWELDVSCSGGFARPVALLPKHITTGFPSDLEDSAIHPGYINQQARRSKFVCGQVRSFRLIEVEVISVLFHGHPINPAMSSLEAWMGDVEDRIHSWRADVDHSASANREPSLKVQWEEMVVFAEIALPQVLVTLFRPCPRIKNPTMPNLLKAFKATVQVVQGYLKQAGMGFGSLKFTFQPCHHVFSSAMVFLHIIRECPSALVSMYTLEEMKGFMSAFSDFFSLTTERWPASSAYMDEYNRLLEPLKEHYFSSVHLTNTSFQYQSDELGEYLSGYNLWSLSGEPGGFSNLVFEPFTDAATANLWQDGGFDSIDWDRYFDLGAC